MDGSTQSNKYIGVTSIAMKDLIAELTKYMRLHFAERDFAKSDKEAELLTQLRHYPESVYVVTVEGDKESVFAQYLEDHHVRYSKLNSPALYEENGAFIISENDYERILSDIKHIKEIGKNPDSSDDRADKDSSPDKDEADSDDRADKNSFPDATSVSKGKFDEELTSDNDYDDLEKQNNKSEDRLDEESDKIYSIDEQQEDISTQDLEKNDIASSADISPVSDGSDLESSSDKEIFDHVEEGNESVTADELDPDNLPLSGNSLSHDDDLALLYDDQEEHLLDNNTVSPEDTALDQTQNHETEENLDMLSGSGVLDMDTGFSPEKDANSDSSGYLDDYPHDASSDAFLEDTPPELNWSEELQEASFQYDSADENDFDSQNQSRFDEESYQADIHELQESSPALSDSEILKEDASQQDSLNEEEPISQSKQQMPVEQESPIPQETNPQEPTSFQEFSAGKEDPSIFSPSLSNDTEDQHESENNSNQLTNRFEPLSTDEPNRQPENSDNVIQTNVYDSSSSLVSPIDDTNMFVDNGFPDGSSSPHQNVGNLSSDNNSSSSDVNHSHINESSEFSIHKHEVGRINAANNHDALASSVSKAVFDPTDEMKDAYTNKGYGEHHTNIATYAGLLQVGSTSAVGSLTCQKIRDTLLEEDKQIVAILAGKEYANRMHLSQDETDQLIQSFQRGLSQGFTSYKAQQKFLDGYSQVLAEDGFILKRGAGDLTVTADVLAQDVVNKGGVLNNFRERKAAQLSGRGKEWKITGQTRQLKNLHSRIEGLSKQNVIPTYNDAYVSGLQQRIAEHSKSVGKYKDIERRAKAAKSRGLSIGLKNAQMHKAMQSDATGQQLIKTQSTLITANTAFKGVNGLLGYRKGQQIDRWNMTLSGSSTLSSSEKKRLQTKIYKANGKKQRYDTLGNWDDQVNKNISHFFIQNGNKLRRGVASFLKSGVAGLEKAGFRKSTRAIRQLNSRRKRIVAKFVKHFGPQSTFAKFIGMPHKIAAWITGGIRQLLVKYMLPPILHFLLGYLIFFLFVVGFAAIATTIVNFYENFTDGVHSMVTADIDNEEVYKSTLGIVYQELLKEETDWVVKLKTDYYDPERPPKLDDFKFLTNFTESGEIDWDNHLVDVETYANNVLNTEYADGKIKGPEPFNLAPDDAYSWLELFDGGAELQFATAGGGYRYASNITEIIALTASAGEQSDLSYQDYPDENKEDIDSEDGAVSFWKQVENVFTSIRIALKNAVTTVFNAALTYFVGDDGKNAFWQKYSTQKNTMVYMAYSKPLFDQSHQEEYSAKMSLLPTLRTSDTVIASWNLTTISSSEHITEKDINDKLNVISSSTVNTAKISYTDAELDLATKIIEMEVSDNKTNSFSSESQSSKYYKGWVACAEVIRNRVLSNAYQKTLAEVLSAKKQFSTYQKAASSKTVNKTIRAIVKRVFDGSEPSVFGRSDVTGWCMAGTGSINHPGQYRVANILGNEYYASTKEPAKQYVVETETAESLNLQGIDMCPDHIHDGYGEMSWNQFFYKDTSEMMYHKVSGNLVEASPVEPAGLHDMPEDICVYDGDDPATWIFRSNHNMQCWSDGVLTGTVSDEEGGAGEYSGSDKITGSNFGYTKIESPDGGKTVEVTVVTKVWKVPTGSHVEKVPNPITGETVEVTVPDFTDHRSTETYSFTHECVGGHTGYYCGGHLRLVITGVVYHISTAEKMETEELMEDKSDNYKVGVISNAGGTVKYLGLGGAVLAKVAERVEEEMGLDEELLKNAQDLFDIDTALVHKAGTVGDSFEGWTIGAQEDAAIKISEPGEWKRNYGIDITGTIGGFQEDFFASTYKLSQSEIDRILNDVSFTGADVSYGDFGASEGDITSVAKAVAQAFVKINPNHPYGNGYNKDHQYHFATVTLPWGNYYLAPCCASGTTLVSKYFGLKADPVSSTAAVSKSSYAGNKVSVTDTNDFRVGDVITYGSSHTEIITKIDGNNIYIAGFGSDGNILKDATQGWNKRIPRGTSLSTVRATLGHSNSQMSVWRPSSGTFSTP